MDRRNLNIFGSGSSSGGHYNKVRISGEGTITDDMDCVQFKTHGSSTLLGNVKVNDFNIYGTVTVKENMKAQVVKVYGTMETDGDISAQQLKIRGTADVGGNIFGEEVNVKGTISANGDCEVEKFFLDGGFQIGGLLNADNVKSELKYGQSKVKEIGGEKITIKKKQSLFGLNKSIGHLTVDIIEGDEIYLENTKASIVRGKKVEVGPGCEINLVEYKESLQQDKTSSVKENRQV